MGAEGRSRAADRAGDESDSEAGSAQAKARRTAATVETKAANDEEDGFALYRLAPLDRDDIRLFAGHRGVTDAEALLDALDRSALMPIAGLPFDLEDIVAIWKEAGSLDSRLAVLERGIARRFELPYDGIPIPLDRALDGARRLALAATLTGEANLRLPGTRTHGLDAPALLPDWTAPEIRSLLGRGVFSDAIYGMVRFRHRETRELLAARGLADMLAHPNGRETVEGMIFRTVYGEAVIVPRLRPLLPWLILFDERIRDRALAMKPEIATEGGDAAKLPLAVRQSLLHKMVARIVTDDARGGDNAQIARIADAQLSEDALALIEAHADSDDAIFFLGRLAWQGKMLAAAMRLASIASDPDRGIYARIVSARAVSMVVGGNACHALWDDINRRDALLPRRLLAEILDCAPPDSRSTELLLASFDRLEPHERSAGSGLKHAIHGFIDRLPMMGARASARPLERLAEGLALFLAREPFIERRDCRVSEPFSWLMGPAMHCVERLLIGRSEACFGQPALAILASVPALRYWGERHGNEERARLSDLVPRWPALNDALFWHTVGEARAALKADGKSLTDDWEVTWIGHFFAFDSASFERSAAWISMRAHADDRSVALSRSFRTYAQNGRPRAWRRALWRAVSGDESLEAKLADMMRPPSAVGAVRARARERKYMSAHRRREEARGRWRLKMVTELRADPDLVGAPPGLEPGQMNNYQARLLESVEGDGLRTSRSGGKRWRDLIPEFGQTVAEAFRDAALKQWRAYLPALRSEGGSTASIPYALVFAMAGLEIEAGDEATGLVSLPEAEVRHALRYALFELNGLPAWFEPLYRAHPDAGWNYIWGETCWELANSVPGETIHYALSAIVYHAPWLHAALAGPICDWFEAHGAANDDCLRYGRTIMSSGGLPADRLAQLGRRRVLDPATPAQQLATWNGIWADADPEPAVAHLEEWLAALRPPGDAQFAEQFIVSLVGGRRADGGSVGAWRMPAMLKRLYLLAHRHVRRTEDLDRANGETYSPTLRDEAQDARSHLFNLLADIPGEATHREILSLAEDHPEVDHRPWMRQRAYTRAVQDSERDWAIPDILTLPGFPARLPAIA